LPPLAPCLLKNSRISGGSLFAICLILTRFRRHSKCLDIYRGFRYNNYVLRPTATARILSPRGYGRLLTKGTKLRGDKHYAKRKGGSSRLDE
jgi:hypothetical protein